MRFNPAWTGQHFKAAFTAAAGWGTYAQQQDEKLFSATITLKYGKLTLTEMGFAAQHNQRLSKAGVQLNGIPIACTLHQTGTGINLVFANTITVGLHQVLSVQLT
ncbi:MAG: hypothetical protein NVSMB7_14930 [Chitinophagaceae bacterium]